MSVHVALSCKQALIILYIRTYTEIRPCKHYLGVLEVGTIPRKEGDSDAKEPRRYKLELARGETRAKLLRADPVFAKPVCFVAPTRSAHHTKPLQPL